MKRAFLIFWLTCCLFISSFAHDRAPLTTVLPAFEPYVDKSMTDEGIPGCAIVVVKDGKIVYSKGFGVKVLGKPEKVDEHTPFALASVTKNFTNTLVARLVDQGKLHWKDKVTKYLPELRLSDPKITEEITIEDLLSHRSGLPGYSADSLIELGWSTPEIIAALKHIPMEGEFRKTYEYQNVMVGLVGEIMKKVTGKSLPELYQEEILNPAGLHETRIGEKQPTNFLQKILNFFKRKQDEPTFHDKFDGTTRALPKGNPNLYTFQASSGMISTGHDLGKWLICQLNNTQINSQRLVSEANVQELRIPRVEVDIKGGRQFPKNRVTKVEYGMGWFLHDYAGVPMLTHMGGMTGTRALILLIPQDNVGIAILTNLGGMRVSLFPEAIRDKFLDLYLNVPDEVDWAKKIREEIEASHEKHEKQRRQDMMQMLSPSRNLDDYQGVFENALYGKVTIYREGDNIVLGYRDHPHIKLKHWNSNIFEFNGSDLSAGFSGLDLGEVLFADDGGKPNRLMITLFREGMDTLFTRVN